LFSKLAVRAIDEGDVDDAVVTADVGSETTFTGEVLVGIVTPAAVFAVAETEAAPGRLAGREESELDATALVLVVDVAAVVMVEGSTTAIKLKFVGRYDGLFEISVQISSRPMLMVLMVLVPRPQQRQPLCNSGTTCM
jgi:hypothetical protein